MDEATKELIADLIEFHRPVIEQAGCSYPDDVFTVHCKACATERKIWKPGDEPIACDIWLRCVELRLLPVG